METERFMSIYSSAVFIGGKQNNTFSFICFS